MGVINVKKFGLAVGLTFVILRVGCVIVLAVNNREQAISFFNTLLHGLDVTSVLRTEMSAREMVYGIIQIFVLGWLSGATRSSLNFPVNSII